MFPKPLIRFDGAVQKEFYDSDMVCLDAGDALSLWERELWRHALKPASAGGRDGFDGLALS